MNSVRCTNMSRFFQCQQVEAQSQYWISAPPPFPSFYVSQSPSFQFFRLGIEAKGPSAAARIGQGAARCGQRRLGGRALRQEQARGPRAVAREGQGAERCGLRRGEGYKNEGRGGAELQYWENPKEKHNFFLGFMPNAHTGLVWDTLQLYHQKASVKSFASGHVSCSLDGESTCTSTCNGSKLSVCLSVCLFVCLSVCLSV